MRATLATLLPVLTHLRTLNISLKNYIIISGGVTGYQHRGSHELSEGRNQEGEG